MVDGKVTPAKAGKRKADPPSNISISSAIKKLKKGPFKLLGRPSDVKSADADAAAHVNTRLQVDGDQPIREEDNHEENDMIAAAAAVSVVLLLAPDSYAGMLPSDTMVAIQLMLQEFPAVEKSLAKPFVLRSQLYSSVADRTLVDRQLEELKHEKKIRVFKLLTAKDDYAIMLMEEYLLQVADSQRRMERKGGKDVAVFDWFKTHVLSSYLNAGITHSELVRLLSGGGGVVEDDCISLLIQGGLLVRQLTDGTSYWFSMPDVGSVLKSLVQGRKEVLGLLSRKKFGEALQSHIMKQKLRFSKLGLKFHIRDLQGLGLIEIVPTTAGSGLRLA